MADIDPVVAWRDAFERVCGLVGDLDEQQLTRCVPACPDWTVRDLFSHMVGLGADVLAGNEPDDHHQEWTQAQVDSRRDRGAEELLVEWRSLTEDLQAWMREHGSRPLNDVVIHEHDLRGAVEVPGGRDAAGLVVVRERMAQRFASRTEALPAIALLGVGFRWASHGEPDDAPVALRADDFDLSRALMSRRSADQLRGWTVAGDVEPYLDAFAGLGPLPHEPLPE